MCITRSPIKCDIWERPCPLLDASRTDQPGTLYPVEESLAIDLTACTSFSWSILATMHPSKALISLFLHAIALISAASRTKNSPTRALATRNDEDEHNLTVNTYWGPGCDEQYLKVNSSFVIPIRLLQHKRCIDVFEVGSVWFDGPCKSFPKVLP